MKNLQLAYEIESTEYRTQLHTTQHQLSILFDKIATLKEKGLINNENAQDLQCYIDTMKKEIYTSIKEIKKESFDRFGII